MAKPPPRAEFRGGFATKFRRPKRNFAKRSGVTRKALRLYEQAGILPAARRTASGYRVYSADALAVLSFVRKAQGLGFTLGEIKDIVAIRRSGRAPCPHVCDLVRRKAADLDRKVADLAEVRRGLSRLLNDWRSWDGAPAAVCPTSSGTTEGGRAMETVKMLLCPAGCSQCPEVEIVGDEVRIGEAGNLSVLKKDEWNVLVDLIQSGRLGRV